jgi:iron complex outermembrane receptor protein
MRAAFPGLCLCLGLCLLPLAALAEEPAEEPAISGDEDIIVLPEAEVGAERDSPDTVTREEMDRDGSEDLWEAVRYVPGVILSGGGRRNDSNFSIRGFGADSVPVFVDGIPLANPYRGEGDSARLLTGDLENVEIMKGSGSTLLGANTLGGAVLMRTAKPGNPLELSARTTLDADSVFRYASSYSMLRAGTKQDFFYAMGAVQYRNTDHYRLSGSFTPSPGSPQGGGDRLWSDSEDLKLTALAGITPLPNLDVWAAYIFQNADKGFSPPDTGPAYSIWRWPVWKRHSVSVNSSFTTGPFSLDGLFYFDKYDNRLEEYYNWKAYTLGIHAPHSDYDEYSLGGRLTGGWESGEKHRLNGALTWKLEDHRGLRGVIGGDDLREVAHVNEATLSAGVEYTGRPWIPCLAFRAGTGIDTQIPVDFWSEENEFQQLIDAGYYIVKSRTMLLYTWQAGIFYTIAGDHELRATYARKNHFPTMAQRYSTRFGAVLPNSSLGPEIANHFELGYRGGFGGMMNLNAAVYYSIMEGKMVTVQIPNPDYPSALVDYTRNLDSVSFYGLELAGEFFPHDLFSAGFAFSWNGYTINRSQAGEEAVAYQPPVTVSGYARVHPWVKFIAVIPRVEYVGPRFADTLGTVELPGYVLFHLKVSADIGDHFSFSAGIENMFDALYEIRRYSPQAGRVFSFSLEARY